MARYISSRGTPIVVQSTHLGPNQSSSVLVFMSSTGRGFQVKYPAITLHAISRAEGTRPSIYCQLDETDSNSPPDDTSEDVTDMRELMIVPQDPESRASYPRHFTEPAHDLHIAVESIFEAMSLCASLHPDPHLSDEDELDSDFVSDTHFETLNGEGEEELSEVGRVRSDFVHDSRYAPY